jgi:S1-C subfamily serine protease
MPAPQDDVIERTLPPHKTWRELPPTPPLGVPLPPPEPTRELLITEAEPVATPPKTKRGRRVLAACIGAVVGAAAVAGVFSVVTRDDNSTDNAAAPVAGASAPNQPESVQSVVKQVAPAVVEIQHDGGVGSGVIYDKSGLILTAHHVVAGADNVTVKTADGQTLDGTVVGRDADHDLAIVAVKAPKDLPTADLADPGSVEIGETAIALGSPFGFSSSVTSGIISGLDRELPIGTTTLTGLIQTDAPINPGNSGGPLVDADAKVIGINTAIASETGGSNGVGFAIPVETAQSLMDQVEAAGGVDAPAVHDDSDSGLGLGQIPGLGQLPDDLSQIPGLDQIPGLEDLLNGDPSQALQQLLDELLGNGTAPNPDDPQSAPDPGSGSENAQPALGLVTVAPTPEGYAQERNQIATTTTGSGVEGHQTIVLRGPRGLVTIEAERGPNAQSGYDDLNGDETQIAGHEAKDITNGYAWVEDGDLLVKVTGDTFVTPEDVKTVAEAVEAVR